MGKLQTYTEVEYYNGIPSTCHAASVVITFANKCDVKAGKGLGRPTWPLFPGAEASGPLPGLWPALWLVAPLLSVHMES